MDKMTKQEKYKEKQRKQSRDAHLRQLAKESRENTRKYFERVKKYEQEPQPIGDKIDSIKSLRHHLGSLCNEAYENSKGEWIVYFKKGDQDAINKIFEEKLVKEVVKHIYMRETKRRPFGRLIGGR